MVLVKLFFSFFKIGLFTVGGGYAMIPFVQKEAVDIHHWVGNAEFGEFIALDTVTPGPIAVNIATFVGYKVGGVWGSIIATVGVVLPSLIIVTIIASLFYSFRQNQIVQAVLSGLKPAVIALILVSILSLIKGKAIVDIMGVVLMIIVFITVGILKVHPIWMVLFSGFSGFIFYYLIK